MSCEHCDIKVCPVLNKLECPIDKLWEYSEAVKRLIEEAERIIRGEA